MCLSNNVKNYVPINPFPSKWVLRALIDFTLSNARRFYSSMGNLLDRKGLILCVLWTLSLDTDLTLWKVSRLLKDNKQCSGEKDILHKSWMWKHPKLITNKNCIGRWICLAMLEEKLQWTSINLLDRRTTKNDSFENIVEHIADL